MPIEIVPLKPLSCSTLALRGLVGSENGPDAVLLYAHKAGDFIAGVSIAHNERPERGPHVWLRGEGLRFPGCRGLTFNLWAGTRDASWGGDASGGGVRYMNVDTLNRGDARANTQAQWSAATQIVREVWEGIQPDLGVLYAADDWRTTEQRVAKVEVEIRALAAEHAALTEKLRGTRPW